MANFKEALNVVLSHEGGHSASKPATYRGIYSGSVPGKNWAGWAFFKGIKPKFNQIFNDPQIVKSVEDFYYKNYWVPYNLEHVQNQKIANFLFDWIVNTNPIKVSRIINTLSNQNPASIIKKTSIDIINSLPLDEVLNKFVNARIVFLNALKLSKNVKKHLISRAKSYL
jgi:lysozyme family protein